VLQIAAAVPAGAASRYVARESKMGIHATASAACPTSDAAYHRALKAGATSIRPPADQSYGERGAGVKDSTGNSWLLATPLGLR
jgi:uncharacterized glyoxalase superfamily protein PhnB